MTENTQARILVVDDDPNILNFFQSVLEDQGYLVETADNGTVALQKAEEFMPDVILLDIIMPEMDGYEVTEALKGAPGTKDVSIVLVTGMDTLEDKVRGLECGADDFITKPFNFDELVARVRSLIKLKRLQEKLTRLQNQCGSILPAIRSLPERRNQILVVEDDERISKLMMNILSTGGHQAVCLGDGLQARDYLSEMVPDLVILDLMLPGVDGMELLKMIRESPATADVPVIVVTAVNDFKTKIKGLYIGADDYLVKPVKSLELLARVRANLRKYQVHKMLRDACDKQFQS